ncbi:MAG: EthD family reductase [Rhodospirillales bacterium]|nr:EthD family reductase [Rhodospirillales bacterium]
MRCISVLYPMQDNEDFDFEFYKRRHVPLIRDILGRSLHKIEVRKGHSSHGGGAPTYVAVISIWIADWEAYEQAMAARTQELLDEVPLFTKVMPIMQIDEVFCEGTP